MGVVDLVLQTVHAFLMGYVSQASKTLSLTVGGLLVAFGTIQILLHGYETMMGRGDPIVGYLMKWGRVWLYASIGLTLGVGNGLLFKFFTAASDWLINAMALASGSGAGGGFEGAMHSFWQQLLAIISAMVNSGSGTPGNPGFFSVLFGQGIGTAMAGLVLALEILLLALLFLIGGVLITVGALVVYLSAEIGLMACLALAPIFVTCGGFKKTEGYFNGWLSQTLNFVLLIGLTGMLFGLAIAMSVPIESKILGVVNGMHTAAVWQGAVAPLLIDTVAWIVLGILIYYFFDQLPSLASGLVGGTGLQNPNDWVRARLQTLSEMRYLSGGKGGGKSAPPGPSGGEIARAREDQSQTRVRPPGAPTA
jgi:type IV secretion system protein VirB6